MNTLNRMIVACAVAGTILTGSLAAQESVDESSRAALAVQREAQIAQKEAALKQKQAAQQQVEAFQKEVEVERAHAAVLALAAQPAAPPVPTAPGAPAPARSIPVRRSLSFQHGGDGAVLVIPSAEIEAEDVVAITEDMNVMSRIFGDNLEQARMQTVPGGLLASSADPWVVLLGGGGAINGMYLQGYGALFLMRMDFPLSAPPQVEEPKPAEKQTESDPVWSETRRNMYEPQEAVRDSQKEPEVKYDAEKVENLKATLIKTLKHAANIRSLKSDESVIITVAGSGRSSGDHVSTIRGGHVAFSQRNQILVTENTGDGTSTAKIVAAPSSDQAAYFSPTALVIRAKKADIDQFAKGNIDAEQFRQRVQVLACPYIGAEGRHTGGLNPYYNLQQAIRY